MKYSGNIMALSILLSLFLSITINAQSSWSPQSKPLSRAAFMINGIEKQHLYFMEDSSESFNLNFYSFSGKLDSTISFRKGKGPGELLFPASLTISNDQIYIFDDKLNKVSIYDRTGHYIDDIVLATVLGTRSQMVVFNNYFVFHDNYEHELFVLDQNGTVIKDMKYSSPIVGNDINGQALNGGCISADESFLYIGSYQKPFTIKIFDKNFLLIKSLTRTIHNSYTSYRYKSSGNGMEGDMLIGSIRSSDNKLYAVYGGNILCEKGKMHISVFDKTTNTYLKDLASKELEDIWGMCKLVGVTDDSLVLFIQGYRNEQKKKLNEKEGFVVFIPKTKF